MEIRNVASSVQPPPQATAAAAGNAARSSAATSLNAISDTPGVTNAPAAKPTLDQVKQAVDQVQQIVRPLRTGLVDLVAFGEGRHRILVVAAGVIGFAQPILRIAGQRILRVLGDEGFEGDLGLGIGAALHETRCIIILFLRGVPRQDDGTAGTCRGLICGAGSIPRWSRAGS